MRRLRGPDGTHLKGKNGHYLRVRVDKRSRYVKKVYCPNWTDEAIAAFRQTYPNGNDTLGRRKKVDKSRVKKPTPSAPPMQTIENPEEEKEDCPICCSELPKATTTLECGHTFCTGCILTWFQHKNNCPMCRAEVKEAPHSAPSVERVHIDQWHARDIIDLTNRVLNGEDLTIRSSFTNTRVGFNDIFTRYPPGRNSMLASRTRREGANGFRFAEAVLEVTNRLSANIGDDGYNEYFGINNTTTHN